LDKAGKSVRGESVNAQDARGFRDGARENERYESEVSSRNKTMEFIYLKPIKF
jgi:hypothetical protein